MGEARGHERVDAELGAVNPRVGGVVDLTRERQQCGAALTVAQQQQAAKPVQTDGREQRAIARALAALRVRAGNRCIRRGVEGLTRDEHHHGEEAGRRKVRQQAERSIDGAQPFFAPGRDAKAEVMTPVRRLELRRASCRGPRLLDFARRGEDEPERGPGFTKRWIEIAGAPRVDPRPIERSAIRRIRRALLFVLQKAGARETGVRRRVVRRRRNRVFEAGERFGQASRVERFERESPFDPVAEWIISDAIRRRGAGRLLRRSPPPGNRVSTAARNR